MLKYCSILETFFFPFDFEGIRWSLSSPGPITTCHLIRRRWNVYCRVVGSTMMWPMARPKCSFAPLEPSSAWKSREQRWWKGSSSFCRRFELNTSDLLCSLGLLYTCINMYSGYLNKLTSLHGITNIWDQCNLFYKKIILLKWSILLKEVFSSYTF